MRSERAHRRARVSWIALGLVWVALIAAHLAPERVAAQACHQSDLPSGSAALPMRIGVAASFASYRNEVYAGEYQGYFASTSYVHPWVSASLAFGGYRIVRNGRIDHGISDLALDVRAALARFKDELALGLELAATLPTGNADLGLGMGHVMLMPGVFMELQRPGLRLLVQLAYGRALVGDHRGHAAGPAPLVNPMNRAEIEHVATLSYEFHTPLFALARVLGAVPIQAQGGRAREVLAVGLGATVSRFQLVAELHLPLLGQPFALKSQLGAVVSF